MAPPQISELSPNPPKRVKIGRNHYIKKEASAPKKKDGKDVCNLNFPDLHICFVN
jgi:hypothetical protein